MLQYFWHGSGMLILQTSIIFVTVLYKCYKRCKYVHSGPHGRPLLAGEWATLSKDQK